MAIESTTTIAGLNALWPLGTDSKSEGDDHIRIIKSVLVADFDDSTAGIMKLKGRSLDVSQVSQRGMLFGLVIANTTTDVTNSIDVNPGSAATDAAIPTVMTLSALMTKKINVAWAVGALAGSLDAGTIQAAGTYHVFLIQRSDTGVVDVLTSLSAVGPTMPAGYDRKRRIASFLRAASANRGFQQVGDTFHIGAIVNRSSTAAQAAILLGTSAPNGIFTRPLLRTSLTMNASSVASVSLGSGSWGNTLTNVQDVTSSVIDTAIVPPVFWTDVSSQIWYALTINAGTVNTCTLATIGWIDDRGRSG
jgi:hypothetical protein